MNLRNTGRIGLATVTLLAAVSCSPRLELAKPTTSFATSPCAQMIERAGYSVIGEKDGSYLVSFYSQDMPYAGIPRVAYIVRNGKIVDGFLRTNYAYDATIDQINATMVEATPEIVQKINDDKQTVQKVSDAIGKGACKQE